MAQFLKLCGAAGLIAGLGACTSPAPPSCAPGVGAPMAVFSLYFGEAIPHRGNLTSKEWKSFLDDTVTPNLPNGYTILDGNGAWMNPVTHKTIREPTRILIAALPEVPDSLTAINRVRSSYQVKFDQQLVGMTIEHACGTF